jgi:hypothetical protein
MINLSWENLKHYVWSIIGLLGIVLFWAGLWDGVGNLWVLVNPVISLIVGIIILASSGLILKEFDPLKDDEIKTSVELQKVHKHPQKHEFHIKFHDRIKKKDVLLEAKHLKQIEKGFLVFAQKEGKELFVPIHRVKEIMHKGKSFWKH